MSNARLKKTLHWQSGLVYNGDFYINQYAASVSIITVSDNHEQQNIAYERTKLWINRVMDDGILISHDDPTLDAWRSTGARIIVLPEEPVDQIIGIMLYLKLNSIMENRLVISEVELGSTVGDNTSYLHSHGESVGEALGQAGWWLDPRPTWYLDPHKISEDNVVNLSRGPEWGDFELEWENNSHDKKNSVVFARFDRNEDQ